MRTNIVIDDQLMAEAMQLTGLRTKRAVVEKALQTLIELSRQGEIEDLFGRLHWEGDLARIREDRIDYAG